MGCISGTFLAFKVSIVVGIIIPVPQDVHILTPETCEYVRLYDKERLRHLQNKKTILDYPLGSIKSPRSLKVEEGGRIVRRRDVMMEEVNTLFLPLMMEEGGCGPRDASNLYNWEKVRKHVIS